MATRKASASLAAVAHRQHGVFTRRQAVQAGYALGQIDHRVHVREWIAVDHGVYRAAETPSSWLQRLMAACLAGPAVASHRAAAELWGFPGFGHGLIEVTALRHKRRKPSDVIWHETVRLDERQATVLEGVPVTRPLRTVIDLGAVVDESALLIALDDVLRRRLASLPGLAEELDQWGERRRGSGRVRRAIALRVGQPVPESVLETEFEELVRREGLPTPSRQWRLRRPDGTLLARVDFAYPAARLAIEIDGARYHDADHDRDRQNDIEAIGWGMLRFTARHIRHRPRHVATRIMSALHHSPASLDAVFQGERRNM
jgi:very-short-patch-repair endonuclease